MPMTKRKSYRFLSGVDDAAFCQRVSDALADGYELYGNPVMVMDGDRRIVGQAIVDPKQIGRKPATRRTAARKTGPHKTRAVRT
ncbi:MAG: DUF1737 domain-containing protein [Alphaproteobacteria bacterium]